MKRARSHISSRKAAMLIAAGVASAIGTAVAEETTLNIGVGEVAEIPVIASPEIGDSFVINNAGTIGSPTSNNRQVLVGDGAGEVVINNDNLIRGLFDFSEANGNVTLHNNTGKGLLDLLVRDITQGWYGGQPSYFGAGDDTIINGANGGMRIGTTLNFGEGSNLLRNDGGDVSIGFTVFGGGDDTIINAGVMRLTVAGSGGVDFGNGNDRLENSGYLEVANVTFGDGVGVFSNTGIAEIRSSIFFSDQNDSISNGAGGIIAVYGDGEFAFGGGNDVFVNEGVLVTNFFEGPSTLVISGLDTFENSGLILLGSKRPSAVGGGVSSDHGADDLLSLQGVNFVASGASRFGMDVRLGGIVQADCSALVAADCVDFTGGSTSGVTLLTILDADLNDPTEALNPGIAIIIGASAAGDFVLSPDSEGYVSHSSLGPGLQKRFVLYGLGYDAATRTHYIYGSLADEALQASVLTAASQAALRDASSGWFDRQADLRATPGGLMSSSGIWSRMGGAVSERDVERTLALGDHMYEYNVDHKQTTGHFTIGTDIVRASRGDTAFVAGAMGSYLHSNVTFDATPTKAIYSGYSAGLYASVLAGGLFVDASATGSALHMGADMPNLGLIEGVKLSQDISAVNGRIDAGWRSEIGDGFFAEPIASVFYLQVDPDNIAMPGAGGIEFVGDQKSLRAGLGVRGGLSATLLGLNANYSLLGRYWEEMEGEATTEIVVGADANKVPLADDFSGGFTEVGAGLNLFSTNGGVSGFVNIGGKFKEEYRSMDASAGMRLRW